MIRKIISINEKKCNGCGLCVNACHEGAIGIFEGKAKLLRDDYCDGLGDCLPACPTNAISFIEREALEYNEAAVLENKAKKETEKNNFFSCLSSQAKKIIQSNDESFSNEKISSKSQLNQWPCQIKLVPLKADYYENADLLIAADCTAYAYADFHNQFMKNKITLIGCPKLDEIDYSQKLTDIFTKNTIKSITIIRMEVPCCKGLENAVKNAIKSSNKFIPYTVITVSVDGKILE